MTRPLKPAQRQYKMTSGVSLASLSQRRWETLWGGAAEGRAAWAALRDHMIAAINVTVRPLPFWVYEPDVPDELRGDGSVESNLDRELDRRRVRWLLGDGKHHQRQDAYARSKGGEAPALYDALERLERELGTLDG